ncbi:MAG TPA: FeoA domain-containing protein [Candidatus Humimicrobiaceae bacterium]|nr:FeoA domain-containing protein [Candidatus Humimicrobiaceae bacterium]
MRRWGLKFRGRESNREYHRAEDIFSMAGAAPGKKYRIMKIDGGCRLNSRLCAMGFIPGEVFYVSGASRGGPLCVLIKGTKFAIGRGMAERIQIREA